MDEEQKATQPAPPAPTVLGPGSIPNAVAAEYTPALEGATRDEIVTILNPMTTDFVARVGVTQNAPMPVRINNPQGFPTRNEADLAAKGISGFRNPDLKGGKVHIANDVLVPAGQTIRQPGDIAQVIVKQMITTILSVRGEKLRLADPESRRNVEKEIIQSRTPMSDLFGSAGGPVSVEEQLKAAVDQANEGLGQEPAFPEAKRLGRPPKAQDAT